MDKTVFAFDVKPFLEGVRKIGAGMDRVQEDARKFGSAMTHAIGAGINGLIVKVGALFAAFKGLKAAIGEIPEIGMAFGIVKDVFLKNLLWPLRQELMPLLQKMVDWTRDHRATFLRWGQAVANVFRTLVVAASSLWDVMTTLAKAVADSFQRTFKTSFGSFDEFVNVVSFKVSAVIIYLSLLAKEIIGRLEPVFDRLFEISKKVIDTFVGVIKRLDFSPFYSEIVRLGENVIAYFEKMLDRIDWRAGFQWVLDMGTEVVGFFNDLLESWDRANTKGDSLWTNLDKIQSTLGLIGGAVQSAASGFREGFIGATSETMTNVSELIDEFNRLLVALGFGDRDGVRQAFVAVGRAAGEALNWTIDMGASILRFFADLAENWGRANESGKSLKTVVGELKELLSTIGSFIENAFAGFAEGFANGSKEIMTPVEDIIAQVNRILGAFGFKDAEGVRGLFNFIGEFVGKGFHAGLTLVAAALEAIADAIESITYAWNGMKAVFSGDWAGAKEWFGKFFTTPEKQTVPGASAIEMEGAGQELPSTVSPRSGPTGFAPMTNRSSPVTVGAPTVIIENVTATEGNAVEVGRKLGKAAAEELAGRFTNMVKLDLMKAGN